MKPSQRPNKVLVIIVTDGEENDSKKYPAEKTDEVKSLITIRKKENWQFMFLCATEEAVLTGESLGVSRGNTFQYTNDVNGNTRMYGAMSFAASSFRSKSVNDADFAVSTSNLFTETSNETVENTDQGSDLA